MSRGVWIGVLCCVAAVDASGQSPVINSIQPLAARPGQGTEFKFSGENLFGPTEVWMLFPGVDPKVTLSREGASATEVTCQIEFPPDAPVGIGSLRLATTNGVSPLQLFMSDDLPAVAENSSNKTVAVAQSLALPTAVDGQADELSFDYFKFSARKDQAVSIEVVAQRLGSRLDPVLRVLNDKGRELAYCDDDPRVGRDSRLRMIIPAVGEYIIELRDINYGGGASFPYRLRVGDFPLPALPFPPFATSETNVLITILGEPLKGSQTDSQDACPALKARIPGDAARVSLPLAFNGRGGSSFVSLLASPQPQPLETEPNDSTTNATEWRVPGAISGRFEQNDDIDLYRFTAEKEQRLVFRGKTRSLGSPCDLFMSIQDPKGATVAEFDPTGPDEGTITNKFKESGSFFLVVEELNRTGGPDLAYHLLAEELRPGFKLSVEDNDLQGRPGGTVELKVMAARHDYDGPIALATSICSGAASSEDNRLSIEKGEILEKKNQGELKIKVSPDLEPGTLLHFRITGVATIDDRWQTDVATTRPALRKLWPNLSHPPPELDGLIALAVRSPESGAKDAESKANTPAE